MSCNIFFVAIGIMFYLSTQVVQAAGVDKKYLAGGHEFTVQQLFKDNDVVWGFDFLSSNKIIFTLRGGMLKVLDLETRKVESVKGTPKVWAKGQGGLLDVRVHPKKRTEIYLTYAKEVGGNATTAIGVAEIQGAELINFRELAVAKGATDTGQHFGSRIEFATDGSIFFSVGDRGERDQAQNKNLHTGKILRLSAEGSNLEIWSSGHRSPQGLVFDPLGKTLWEAEMGPRGGDELNIIKKDANYGWPTVTYGREYYGPKIGEGTSKPGFANPVVYWVPSISPSAITFYTGDIFKNWRGNLFMATLSGMHLRRLEIANDKVVSQDVMLLDMRERFRNVRTGPDGYIYLSTDSGLILRLLPLSAKVPDGKGQSNH